MKRKYTLQFWLGVFLTLFISCTQRTPKSGTSVVVDTEMPAKEDGKSKEEPTSENRQKTNEELAVDVVKQAVEIGRTLIADMHKNDSIKMAQREKMYAYQIGLPISDIDEVFDAYIQVKDENGIYVLKKSSSDYYLIKYEAKTESELQSSLLEFKGRMAARINGGVKVINVMNLCSRNEKLMIGEKLIKRKEHLAIPCLICN